MRGDFATERTRKMTRWIAALGCGLALALTVPLGNDAAADGYGGHAYAHKRCIASKRFAPNTTWVCPISRQCCYDWLRRKGTCIAPTARCI